MISRPRRSRAAMACLQSQGDRTAPARVAAQRRTAGTRAFLFSARNGAFDFAPGEESRRPPLRTDDRGAAGVGSTLPIAPGPHRPNAATDCDENSLAFGTEVYRGDAGGTMLEPRPTEIPPQRSDNTRTAIRITPKPMIVVETAIRGGVQRVKPFPELPAGILAWQRQVPDRDRQETDDRRFRRRVLRDFELVARFWQVTGIPSKSSAILLRRLDRS